MGIRIYFVFVFWSFVVNVTPVHGQSGEAEREVVFLLEQFFHDFKGKDVDAITVHFHPQATLHTVRNLEGENYSSILVLSINEFLDRIESSRDLWEENLLSVDVRVDGHMATAWAPYEFYVEGEFHHCGVNAFQFVRSKEGWRITHVMDTRREEGCR